ncbi:hypothetical protein EV401DRAFT_254642 [Pisolithus croceorrhizus]|nr:hypothetical protein EV401DRAFT_254642 [Pisolithus croceorrhizus]
MVPAPTRRIGKKLGEKELRNGQRDVVRSGSLMKDKGSILAGCTPSHRYTGEVVLFVHTFIPSQFIKKGVYICIPKIGSVVHARYECRHSPPSQNFVSLGRTLSVNSPVSPISSQCFHHSIRGHDSTWIVRNLGGLTLKCNVLWCGYTRQVTVRKNIAYWGIVIGFRVGVLVTWNVPNPTH